MAKNKGGRGNKIEVKDEAVIQALDNCNGSCVLAAQELGISFKSLYNILDEKPEIKSFKDELQARKQKYYFITEEDVREALSITYGQMNKAAELLGCSYEKIKSLTKNNNALKEHIEECRQTLKEIKEEEAYFRSLELDNEMYNIATSDSTAISTKMKIDAMTRYLNAHHPEYIFKQKRQQDITISQSVGVMMIPTVDQCQWEHLSNQYHVKQIERKEALDNVIDVEGS